MQNFSFCGSGWSFWYLFFALFCHFFMQKFSFLRGWEVFFTKKTTFFFMQNFSVLSRQVLFLVPFFCTFLSIFQNPHRQDDFQFFMQNVCFLSRQVLFLSKKMQDFEIFLRFIRKRSRSAKAGSLEPSVRVDPLSTRFICTPITSAEVEPNFRSFQT